MNAVELESFATHQIKPSDWFHTMGLSQHADARDIDGIITAPDAANAAYLSLYGAIKRSYPNDTARWLQVASKLDAFLADLHADPERRMRHCWIPDSRFNRIARANDHRDFTREEATWLLESIGE
ncbi:MAG: hypothetical protein FJ143_10210 [Deltaproteobacteria bacterium]|nr:hypothetical protein [Deltaproteobacteria bacterium]MBM4298101.1 hypothetical protein [Deltaproteobacteria bacterium]